jgi:hypothetical protein
VLFSNFHQCPGEKERGRKERGGGPEGEGQQVNRKTERGRERGREGEGSALFLRSARICLPLTNTFTYYNNTKLSKSALMHAYVCLPLSLSGLDMLYTFTGPGDTITLEKFVYSYLYLIILLLNFLWHILTGPGDTITLEKGVYSLNTQIKIEQDLTVQVCVFLSVFLMCS